MLRKAALFITFVLISFPLYAQTVSVSFNVNMTYQIKAGNFNPESDFVDVAGTFNNWGENLIKLSDNDQDSIYSVVLDGFTPGTEIQYKFRLNGQWDGTEEFPGAGNNRVYTVQADSNFILVWYNDEVDNTGPPNVDFYTINTRVFTNSLVQFVNQSSGNIDTLQWYFEGGTPAESGEVNPVIRYSTPGTYDVQLIAGNSTTRDTLLIEDYITVSQRESSETHWWNEAVFYEIFVRSFYDSDGDGIGDFNGITQKLDYLNDGNPETDTDLGITGIWLMPIHPSPTYHGYDAIDYRAINPDYGTMEDFKTFLSEAHKRGIRVIIDYVMNHTSTEHPWFKRSAAGWSQYRDFYRWSNTHPGYSGPWGQNVWHERNGDYYYGVFWSGMPDLNYENPAVKDSMFAISDYWINQIGVDGFRQDAVLYIDEDGQDMKNTPETFDFWNAFNTNLKAANPEAFAVGEAWEPTDIALKYMSDDRLDYVFEFDLAQSILRSVYEGTNTSLIAQMQKVYDSYPFLQYGTFLTNHDQNRVFNVLNRDMNKAKVAASLYLTLPGIPYLYYGEEVAMLGTKPDPEIRLPMQWSGEAYAGFSTVTPWKSPNDNYTEYNVELMETNESSLLNHYKKLIQIRNESSQFQTGKYEAAISSSDEVMAFFRYDETLEQSKLVIINLGGNSISDLTLHHSDQMLADTTGATYSYKNIITGNENGTSYPSEYGYSSDFQNIAPYSTNIYSISVLSLSLEESQKAKGFNLDQNYPKLSDPIEWP